MLDLVIKNVKIYDGTEAAAYVADIGIRNERICEIGKVEEDCAREHIDAAGLCVMPGFIDTHCHSDMALLYDRQHANGIQQGITTEILGQDGLSYAPLSHDNLEMYARYLRGLNGWFEDIPLNFSSVSEYLDRFDKKVAPNVVYQVPHGTLRLEAMGFHDRPLSGYALARTQDLMRRSFEEGAVAFSTGLSYYPCSYADTKEMIELCRICAEYDVPYVTHTRTVFRGEPFDATLEAIRIAREAGCRLHFSHFRTGPDNCGRTAELMEPIEKAIADGMKITLETYPYYSGSGYAVIFLPPWAVEGGYEATLERLGNPVLRAEICEGMRQNTIPTAGTFTHLRKNEIYVGMDFTEVAKLRGTTVENMICDILLEEELDVGYYSNPVQSREIREQMDKDFIWLLTRPYYMVCSDSIPYGLKPHPRSFGTFPRFLRLAREQGIGFDVMANRMAAVPARIFGLKDRGIIAKGYYGDLVLLDEDKVTDKATYQNPRRAPEGIKHVIINGQIAVYDEKVTGLFAGHALRKERR